MTCAERFRIAGHVRAVFDPSDGSGVLLDCHKGKWRHVSPTMGYVWRLLSQQDSTLEELSGKVSARYGISLEQARADLQPTLDELRRQRLLVPPCRRKWWR